jgi:phospholipid/cholesterol/gamma-HCH transport system substrate-binding protein
MKRFKIETAVGLFLVAGFICFAYLSVKLGDLNLLGDKTYQVVASFNSISGLKEGASVEIAGVQVGKVSKVSLDTKNYEAQVELAINNGVEIQEDSIASVRTAGIIGDKYISISPGGSPQNIGPGGEIIETESAINLEELVSKYIFEKQ